MPGMRVSLVARLVSHPPVDFVGPRRRPHGLRLGLDGLRTTYHRPSAGARARVPLSVTALRPLTSRFRFPAVSRASRLPARRQALPFGLPRARRA